MNITDARDLITRLFTIIDSADYDRLGDVFAAEAVYERPGYEPLQGLPRIEQFYRHERVIGSGQHTVEDVTCSETGSAVSFGVFRGTSRAGEALEERFADVYRVQGGKIVQRTTYFFRPAI